MFDRLKTRLVGWIAPESDPGPMQGATPTLRIGSLLMTGFGETRHVYLSANGGSQDIRYQISSLLGVPLCDLVEVEKENGLIGMYVKENPSFKTEDNRVQGKRASYILERKVWGPCYFLHAAPYTNCKYGNARAELLVITGHHHPNAGGGDSLIQSNQRVINALVSEPDAADPGPQQNPVDLDLQQNPVDLDLVEDNIPQSPTLSQPLLQILPLVPEDSIRKMDTADNMSGTFGPTKHMDNNTSILHIESMPQSPEPVRNRDNTLDPEYNSMNRIFKAPKPYIRNYDAFGHVCEAEPTHVEKRERSPSPVRDPPLSLKRQTVAPIRRRSRRIAKLHKK